MPASFQQQAIYCNLEILGQALDEPLLDGTHQYVPMFNLLKHQIF
jgi:hypothetical protein